MSPHLRTARAVALVCALVIGVAACSDDDGTVAPSTTRVQPTDGLGTVRQPALEGTLSVVASDTLAAALPDLVEQFTLRNPGVEITVRFDTASVLAMQLLDGEPADVFISSDQENMQVLVAAGRIDGSPQVVARNRLVIVTPPGNPAGIGTIADLAAAGDVGLCDASTPCGALADTVIDSAGVDLPRASTDRRPTALEAIAAVTDGEVAGALVFASIAEAAGDAVTVVELAPDLPATADQPAATLAPAVNALAARAFVDFMLSPEGQEILTAGGFLPPA